MVQTGLTGNRNLRIYPNPVGPDAVITLVIPFGVNGTASLSLIDLQGKIVRSRTVPLTSGSNTLRWDLAGLAAGIYAVRVSGGPDGPLYSKITLSSSPPR
jgi:hypothetical protein